MALTTDRDISLAYLVNDDDERPTPRVTAYEEIAGFGEDQPPMITSGNLARYLDLAG